MNVLGYMQRLGKALMLPIAILPVAALLLRLGQADLLNVPFMAKAGGSIFDNLPLLFALGIAVGLAKGDGGGAAALAGGVGYFVLTAGSAAINSHVNMSFFAGIIAGIIAGHSYNRFHAVELPQFLAFFGGKRLVPIMTGLISLVPAFAAGYIWPSIQHGINMLGNSISDSGALGGFFYGVLNRALLPLGLHHVLNSFFWFGLGEYTTPAGEIVRGDIARFFAGDPTAGAFMTGFYPVMMFGLPAAALAMYLAAPKKNRAAVGGMLLSVALTTFLTGITEPIEFMFVFIAPGLYIIHALLTGLSFVVTDLMGVRDGFGFSAGAFDLVLNWGLATKPIRLCLIGCGFSVIYFCLFYFSIKAFNIKTPGREEDIAYEENTGTVQVGNRGEQYIALLGGDGNLAIVDACITRLRLTLEDSSLVNGSGLKAIGAKGIVHLGKNNVQVILGPQAEIIADEIKAALRRP